MKLSPKLLWSFGWIVHRPCAFLPSTLEDIDSLNFALGLADFDPAKHQPHPPGYPIFIALAKAVRVMVPSDATAMALARRCVRCARGLSDDEDFRRRRGAGWPPGRSFDCRRVADRASCRREPAVLVQREPPHERRAGFCRHTRRPGGSGGGVRAAAVESRAHAGSARRFGQDDRARRVSCPPSPSACGRRRSCSRCRCCSSCWSSAPGAARRARCWAAR